MTGVCSDSLVRNLVMGDWVGVEVAFFFLPFWEFWGSLGFLEFGRLFVVCCSSVVCCVLLVRWLLHRSGARFLRQVLLLTVIRQTKRLYDCSQDPLENMHHCFVDRMNNSAALQCPADDHVHFNAFSHFAPHTPSKRTCEKALTTLAGVYKKTFLFVASWV